MEDNTELKNKLRQVIEKCNHEYRGEGEQLGGGECYTCKKCGRTMVIYSSLYPRAVSVSGSGK